MQRASCCCSGSRSGCCCWTICMLHAKCLSIEFVWLSVATSCGSTLTFFLLLIDLSCCCCCLCMVFFFINHSSNCHQYYLRLTLPFYAAVCPFISLNDLLTAWGNGTWGSGRHLHAEVGEADILVRPVRAKDTSVHLYMHMHNLC